MKIEENRDISFHVALKMEMVFEKRCSVRVCFGVPCQDRFQFRFVKCFKQTLSLSFPTLIAVLSF